MNCILRLGLTLLILLPSCINSQQNYSGVGVCSLQSESLFYTCNGLNSSCRAFLTFTSLSPYDTAAAIANLTSSDQIEISRINNITTFQLLPQGREVIIPVKCSCSGQKYGATTTYQILLGETYFTIANKTFQGFTTCNALKRANPYQVTNLLAGQSLLVPLRCACPTVKQAAVGTEFLLSYTVGYDDTITALSERFNVSVMSIRDANSFTDESVIIQPFTAILIPFSSQPSYSHIKSDKYKKPPLPVLRSRSNRVVLIGGIAAGAFSLLILLLLAVLFLYRKRRAQVPECRGRNAKVSSPQELILEIAKLDRALKVYKFSEIKKATRDFRSKRRIKDHGYPGTFNREVLAVKKSSGNADQEMKMLYKINHFNIVRLHGFCQHEDDLYLVYEYMANGSLREWLSRKRSHNEESWDQTIRIALDVANGLLYLHNFANPAYVHNNVTSSNILLDSNLRAKIANFSVAREANCKSVGRVVGSKGYMAAECLDAGPVSPKVDVYAFGVVLLELITNKAPVLGQDGRERLISTTIAALMEGPNAETELRRFVGPGLTENGGIQYAIQVVKLSLSCLIQDPSDRPDMVEVVSLLLKMQSVIQKATVRS